MTDNNSPPQQHIDLSQVVNALGVGGVAQPVVAPSAQHLVARLERVDIKEKVLFVQEQREKLEVATQKAHAALARLQAERAEYEVLSKEMWHAIAEEVPHVRHTPQHYSIDPNTMNLYSLSFDKDDVPPVGNGGQGFLQ